MKVLVFGQTGQVARALQRAMPEAHCLGRADADLADPQACQAAIRAHAPDAVINAAAYTQVDGAETEEALATIINGQAPGAMAQTCAALDVPFVHISTDYVFDGSGTAPWPTDAPTGPLGAYGRSKLAGEQAVADAKGRFAILRTSWVFSGDGANFLRTMLRLGAERDQLSIVSDQIGGPTPASANAEACLRMAQELVQDPEKSGIYHLSGAPDTCWADFARTIFEAAGMAVSVQDIPTRAYPTPAARPLNSRLECSTLASGFGITRPDWRHATRIIVRHLT